MFIVSDMMRVALAQYAIVVGVAALCGLISGQTALISALLGGLSYAVPTSVYVGLLALLRRVTKQAGVNAFAVLIGEFVKIFVALLMMLLSAEFYHLNWPAFLFSLIAVVNGYFVMLFKKH